MGQEYIEDRCSIISQGQKDELLPFEKPLFDIVNVFDSEVLGQVNSYMCSEACPCYKRNEDYQKYMEISEAEFNEFGRTKNLGSSEYDPVLWSTESGLSFLSFKSCYDFFQGK